MEISEKQCWVAAAQLIRAHAELEERFSGALGAIHGLSLTEAMLLLHVAQAEGRRLSRIDLAKRLSISPSSVTRLTAPMEKRGLVGRESNPRDARYAYVVLTDAGQRAITDASATLERASARMFENLWSPAEIATLTQLLGRLSLGYPVPLG